MRSAVLRSIPLVIAITVVPVAARAQSAGADTAQRAVPAVPSPVAAVPIPPATTDPATITPAAAPAESGTASTETAAPTVSTESAATAPGAWRGLAAGDTVRLVSAAGRYAGTISRVTADTVVIAGRGRSDAVVRSDVMEMYRLTGRGSRGRAMLRGGGLGLIGGAALGLLAGATVARVECKPTDTDCSPGRDKTIPVALTADGAILGALLGIMTGPAFRHTNWERVDAAPAPALPPVSVTPAPGGGVSLGATLRL
ncbi:MAG TPA: hypothetical protein VF092_01655 [Longimicrobium sp.]